jgi:hypothetical protein
MLPYIAAPWILWVSSNMFKHVQTSLGISRIPTSNIPQATATSQKKKGLVQGTLGSRQQGLVHAPVVVGLHLPEMPKMVYRMVPPSYVCWFLSPSKYKYNNYKYDTLLNHSRYYSYKITHNYLLYYC